MATQPGTLTITFQRLSAWQSASVALRDDGVTVRVPGYGPVLPLPHDLAHYIVERELGLTRGFWGSVAAGAMFPGMAVLAGRRRPHATERGTAVIKANSAQITRAESLVGGFTVALHEGRTATDSALLRALNADATATGGAPVDPATLARASAALNETVARWRDVPTGGVLAVRWEQPGGPIQPADVRRTGHRGAVRPGAGHTGRRTGPAGGRR
jgi:hypothetical protein